MRERGQVTLGDTAIPFTIIRSARRRKTVEITLDPQEGVLVAAPIGTPGHQIAAIVAKRANWIARRISSRVLPAQQREFVSGDTLPYLGQQVRLLVEPSDGKRVMVDFTHEDLRVAVPARLTGAERHIAITTALTRWYQQRAAERLPERTTIWAQQAGYAPSAVLIRSQRRRWGSCAADGALRFNWRILMAPPALVDYVIVHELAHLRVRNHSALFWAEVARLMPDYQIHRTQLREIGASLAL